MGRMRYACLGTGGVPVTNGSKEVFSIFRNIICPWSTVSQHPSRKALNMTNLNRNYIIIRYLVASAVMR